MLFAPFPLNIFYGYEETDAWDATKEHQKDAGDKPDSNKQFREAEHQAREDAQKSGDLPERAANKAEQGESKGDKK